MRLFSVETQVSDGFIFRTDVNKSFSNLKGVNMGILKAEFLLVGKFSVQNSTVRQNQWVLKGLCHGSPVHFV